MRGAGGICARIIILISLFGGVATAADSGNVDPLAKAFGRMPTVWGMRMSPKGDKISFLQMYPDDFPVLVVLDIESRTGKPVMSAGRDELELTSCTWANKERLLCRAYGIMRSAFTLVPYTRYVAINADGSNPEVLLRREQENTQFALNVVDMLPADPKHILVRANDDDGINLRRLNIYNGRSRTVERGREFIDDWMTDGTGTPRLRLKSGEYETRWEYVLAGDGDWETLYERDYDRCGPEKYTERDTYVPAGFGAVPNKLYVYKPYDGRRALWVVDLETPEAPAELVYAHPDVDVDGVVRLGRSRRLIGVTYTTDKSYIEFFDERAEEIVETFNRRYPDKIPRLIQESWDQRFYLVHLSGDTAPGTYYRYDARSGQMIMLAHSYPQLENRLLAKMRPIRYEARDGTEIPGYLTLPRDIVPEDLPTVILPHGGPASRDDWGFKWMEQFLAAKGFVVLQSNYRGSGGFGEGWLGEGGYKRWRQVIHDLVDGTKALISDGIADPNRICIVGWSYGGYAALLAAIEAPGLYRCVVSVAGITDPWTHIRSKRNYSGYQAYRAQFGSDDEVMDEGSPLKRGEELKAPVLLLHGDRDVDVAVRNSEKLADELEDLNKRHEYVEYEGVDHFFDSDVHRVDMLDRIARFLDRHIGEARSTAAPP